MNPQIIHRSTKTRGEVSHIDSLGGETFGFWHSHHRHSTPPIETPLQTQAQDQKKKTKEFKVPTWPPNSPDPNLTERPRAVLERKSDQWRPHHGSDLALTCRGLGHKHLWVCPVASGTTAADPLSPVDRVAARLWIWFVLGCHEGSEKCGGQLDT